MDQRIAPEATFTLDGRPVLEYLPVVDLATGRLLGMEALVRWVHPQLGLLGPDRMLPMAESSGDMVLLSQWVLAEACGQARVWSSSMQLAVNCSTSQLRNGDAVRAVGSALESSGLDAGQLTLEINEDSVVDDSAADDLRTLTTMGVQLAVDDVGTSWSSFEPLRRLAVNTVKIDRSFVTGLEPAQGINRLVVETVIHMAHSLGMSAIAVGVETAQQVELVRSFDADAAQGYFFARPLPAAEATALASALAVPHYSRSAPLTVLPVSGAPGDHAAEEATRSGAEDRDGTEAADDGSPTGEEPAEGSSSGRTGQRGAGAAKRTNGAGKSTKPSPDGKPGARKRASGGTAESVA
ncbi:MAG: EAL domain-containing protein [Acidimicrobiales bacterium]|jgi:EAL domain-containing protein (putative c-di-GMP-specific phosphodiesterase class I)